MYLEKKKLSAALQPCKPAWFRTGLEFGVYTFLRHLELPALGNFDRLDRFIARALGHVLDLVNDIVALNNLAKDNVAAIEPACDDCSDEKLGSIAAIC
jgi:hypothetical protein